MQQSRLGNATQSLGRIFNFRFWVVIISLLLGVDLFCRWIGESLWFEEVGYFAVFLIRLRTQGLIWVLGGGLSLLFLGGNLRLADRLQHSITPQTLYLGTLRLRSLIPLLLIVGGLIGWQLLYYISLGQGLWTAQAQASIPPIPTPFSPWSLISSLSNLGIQLREPLTSLGWQGAVLVGILLALAVNARFWLWAIAIVLSLFFGFSLSVHWSNILQFFNPLSFNQADPLFQKDISFYIFKFPSLELSEFWLNGLLSYALLSVMTLYILNQKNLSEGKFTGLSTAQLQHISLLLSAFFSFMAWQYWLGRFKLLYSGQGIVFGASYTDIQVDLPFDTFLSIFNLFLSILFVGFALFIRVNQPLARLGKLLRICLAAILCLYLSPFITRMLVQRFVVQPNELARETPYIQRAIESTRSAFDLNQIEVETFDPIGDLTQESLENNQLTLRNIRLWDTRPLLATNRQLQQIRLYYKFLDADIDRYSLNSNSPNQISPVEANERQQVLVTARELDYSAVPQEAQTWVNRHLIYTHGFGFTVSPVNKVSEGGLPAYYVKDITSDELGVSTGILGTSDEKISKVFPTDNPRIYYGELTDNYVMTGTKVQEFDYPSGNDNVYNVYDGNGGVSLSSLGRRLLFAGYLKDWQMLFTRNFTPGTKLLFRRNIKDRIQTIAPFLRYDQDPYLVIANTGQKQSFLYWIVDAYTTSDRFPYSDPGSHAFNYIRNSVKVVVDAYHGSVQFYIADPTDPIIQSYAKIFPGLFRSIKEMPASLQKHLRYPVDFFNIQAERLLTYHMTDPQVFYNREDQWQIPQEIYGSEPQAVEAYYLIMRLPTAQMEEFVLLMPFTPTQRNNLIGWLAARSDGENYGRLLLYRFPKQRLVYGTEQIEALINQDPVISQQISLWNRQGSRVIQGNLLVIPIERSLLYVEPLYLEAAQNSLPTLVRVVVAFENRIVMAQTLEQALQAIFQREETPRPIIRPVEETP